MLGRLRRWARSPHRAHRQDNQGRRVGQGQGQPGTRATVGERRRSLPGAPPAPESRSWPAPPPTSARGPGTKTPIPSGPAPLRGPTSTAPALPWPRPSPWNRGPGRRRGPRRRSPHPEGRRRSSPGQVHRASPRPLESRSWTWPPGRGDKEYHCINGIAGGRPARLLRADQGETMPLRSNVARPGPRGAAG